jgi:hypothetical protein
MGRIRDAFNAAFPDGPSSAPAMPSKPDIRAAGAIIEAEVAGAAAGLVRSTTLAGLGSGTRVGQPGQVTTGADKGEYHWNGSSWVRDGDLFDASDFGPSLLPETRDLIATDPNSWSQYQAAAANELVSTLKTGGVWGNLDSLIVIGPSVVASFTDWKVPTRSASILGGAPSFVANRHFALDGVDDVIETGFGPSAVGNTMTPASMGIAVFDRLNIASAGYAAGLDGTGSRTVSLLPRNDAGQVLPRLNTGDVLTGVADVSGLLASDISGLDLRLYRNGVQAASKSPATLTATIMPLSTVVVGALRNSSGTPILFRRMEFAAFVAYSHLTDAKHLILAKALNRYLQQIAPAQVTPSAYAGPTLREETKSLLSSWSTVPMQRALDADAAISSLVASGIWAKLESLLVIGHDQAASFIDWKAPWRTASVGGGAPVFVANSHIELDGVDDYLISGMAPSSSSIMIPSSMGMAVWDRLNTASAGYTAGVASSAGRNFQMQSRSASNTLGAGLDAPLVLTGISDGSGLVAVDRDAATIGAYRNGVSLGSAAAVNSSTAMPLGPAFIGSLRASSGAPALFRRMKWSAFAAFSHLTAAEHAALYLAMAGYLGAIGPVYDFTTAYEEGLA